MYCEKDPICHVSASVEGGDINRGLQEIYYGSPGGGATLICVCSCSPPRKRETLTLALETIITLGGGGAAESLECSIKYCILRLQSGAIYITIAV